MTMFEVHPIQGVLDRDISRQHYPDEFDVSSYRDGFVKSNISTAAMTTNFPSDGFDLKLHIFYSKYFKDKFGAGTESKYVAVVIFERPLLFYFFYFHVPLYTGLLHLWDILRPLCHGHHWMPK